MRNKIISIAFAGLLLQGCTQVAAPNTPVKFYTPSKLSIVKKGSKIYINDSYSNGIDQKYLIKNLNDYINENKIFQTVNSINDADVVINVSSFYSYRKDNSKQTRYNTVYEVKREIYRDSRGRETGGKDHVVKSDFASSIATLVFSISIYDKKNLQPLAYLSIIPEESSLGTGSLVSDTKFQESFSTQVIKKLEDLISTKVKNVKIFIPSKVDQTLKSLVLRGDYSEAQNYSKTVLPQLDITELNEDFYIKNKEDASQKDSAVVLRDKESDLSNYYMYLISKEANDVSAVNLRYLFQGYKKILKMTQDDSMIMAVSNSLGRLEFKANRLKINLGE